MVLLAGCAAPPPSGRLVVQGSGPVALAGYDYLAASAERGAGTFALDADPAAETASLTASFRFQGRAWTIRLQNTSGPEAWQQGGIAQDLYLRGASGHGDGLLPAYHALAAGWGEGTVEVDGQALRDPGTGAERFAVAWSVADLAPRDPASMRVLRVDSSVYDPAEPGDGRLFEGAPQVLLDVMSIGGVLPLGTAAHWGAEVTSRGFVNIHAFQLDHATAHAVLDIRLTGAGSGAPAANIDFEVFDAAGNRPAAWTYDPVTGAQGRTSGTLDIPPPVLAGPYNLRARGLGAGASYTADLTVDYPDSLHVHVAYPDVRLG